MNKLRKYKGPYGETEVTMAKSEKEEDQLCDFCSSQERPFKLFMCNDFAIGKANTISRGGWMACPPCAKLIDHRATEALLQRSLRALALNNPMAPRWYITEQLRNLHAKFFRNLISNS